MPRKAKEPKETKARKTAGTEMGTNTKLWNVKPLKEVTSDGVRTKAAAKVIVTVINEDAYRNILSLSLQKALENVGFERHHFEQLGFQIGETHEITLAIRCKEAGSTDAPGQTKIGDPDTETDADQGDQDTDGRIGDEV